MMVPLRKSFVLVCLSFAILVENTIAQDSDQGTKGSSKPSVEKRKAELILRGKDDIELVRFIRDRIIEKSKERKQDDMQNYSDEYELVRRERRSGKSITSLEMIAIKGGAFMMGSPA